MHIQKTILSLALITPSLLAHATNDDLLGISAIGTLCLAQDESNKNTPVGKIISNEAGYKNWESSLGEKKLKCISEEKVIPKSMCDAILNQNPNGKLENSETILEQSKLVFPKIQSLEKKCSSSQ